MPSAKPQYIITASAGTGGSISTTTPLTQDSGTVFHFTASANAHYKFTSWGAASGVTYLNNSNLTPVCSLTTIGTHSITASFHNISITLTTATTGSGTTTPSTGSVDSGAVTVISNSPANGWAFKSWSVTGGATLGSNVATNPNTVTLTTTGSVTATDTLMPVIPAYTFNPNGKANANPMGNGFISCDANAMQILNNYIVPTGYSYCFAYYNSPVDNDQYSYCIIGAAEERINACVRMQTSNCYCYFAVEFNDGLHLYKKNIDGPAEITTSKSLTWAIGDTLKCVAIGSKIYAIKNHSDTISATDTEFPSGYAGLGGIYPIPQISFWGGGDIVNTPCVTKMLNSLGGTLTKVTR